jgi:nitrate reductase molybdenum cofactor assembly chaperone NarJ/NarW
MAQSYRALAVMLSYPTAENAALMKAALEALEREKLIPARMVRRLTPLASELSARDLYELQARYVDLFDRTRSLSLQLYEHVHGESRDRGQAMVELLKLYSARGLELTAKELPDHLPVFLEFLSMLPMAEAAALLGEAAHVLEALRERLKKRRSPYGRVFDALVALVESERNAEALKALLQEPDDDPNDLEALDRAWTEEQVSFGPDKVGCPKAAEMVAGMEAPAR